MPEIRLTGVPLSPGVAVGRACFYRSTAVDDAPGAADPVRESERLDLSLTRLATRLVTLAGETAARLGADAAEIFHAHRMILEDPALRRQLFDQLAAGGVSAESVVEQQFSRYRALLTAADTGYLAERAADLAELQQCLLADLRVALPSRHCQDCAHCSIGRCTLGNDHILVAGEMAPSLPVEVDRHTLGFLVERGGPNSHAAILARGLRLPAVGGIADLATTLPADALLLIDGASGEVVINPSSQRRRRCREGRGRPDHSFPVHAPIPWLAVMATIARAAEVHEACRARADGIGLYRTELELLCEGRLLGEQEQFALYREVAAAMDGKPVYIRLFDLGADKAAAWLGLPREENPVLGCRGARLLLARPDILQPQARALARAAVDRPIHVVYPMISDLAQYRAIRADFDAAVADLPASKLSHGVLFEVPSACLEARTILAEAGFGSIGTNDLIQYLFAEDRAHASAARAERCAHPALWAVLEDLARTGRECGTPMLVCGECASVPALVPRFVRAGFSTISTAPRNIAAVRRAATRPHLV